MIYAKITYCNRIATNRSEIWACSGRIHNKVSRCVNECHLRLQCTGSAFAGKGSEKIVALRKMN